MIWKELQNVNLLYTSPRSSAGRCPDESGPRATSSTGPPLDSTLYVPISRPAADSRLRMPSSMPPTRSLGQLIPISGRAVRFPDGGCAARCCGGPLESAVAAAGCNKRALEFAPESPGRACRRVITSMLSRTFVAPTAQRQTRAGPPQQRVRIRVWKAHRTAWRSYSCPKLRVGASSGHSKPGGLGAYVKLGRSSVESERWPRQLVARGPELLWAASS